MNYDKIANLLFPEIIEDVSFYELKYPERNINYVMRFAPSPTGFIHMGSLYVSFISELFAHKNNGIFYLRIEDTDQKRKIEEGIETIVNGLKKFDIKIDEGPEIGGNYGPYVQSERKKIYLCYAKSLIKKGLAYPCFCDELELSQIKTEQAAKKERIGYYGKWAKDRNLTESEIIQKIKQNQPFVIRLKSNGNFDKKVCIKDLVKGEIEFPENDMDAILIKSDGLPTYHFAHVIDDHLMHTTHIIRGDEWLSSLPLHYQLFKYLNFKVPKYAHISPIMKNDAGSIRKLSKRHDPECNIEYFYNKGIPTEAIKIYLATLINSNFESWYINNKNSRISDFDFSFNRMSVSGPLFDEEKLNNISKTYFSILPASKIYDGLIEYTQKYDSKIYNLLCTNREYTINILNIERNKKRPRKDIYCYSDFYKLFSYMYNSFYEEKFVSYDKPKDYKSILLDFQKSFNISDSEEEWMNKIKYICNKYNYAATIKEYNNESKEYNGHIGDICLLIRVSITNRLETPNIYEIMQVLGQTETIKRIDYFINMS